MMKLNLMKKFKESAERFSEYTEERHEHKADLRKKTAYVLIILILTGEAGALFWNSGCVKGTNEKADSYREAGIKEADAVTITAGNIYDRNGMLLVESFLKKDDKTQEIYEESRYIEGTLYSNLIGYTTRKYIIYGNDILEGVTEYQSDYRLMQYYRDWLYSIADADDVKGGSICLTIDHNLQKKVSELLRTELQADGNGSALVMNAKTGEILAMVSFPEFDFNNLSGSIAQMSEVKDAYYPITHKNAMVPGSIFKIVTAVSMIDAGMEDFRTVDTPFVLGSRTITNAYGDAGDEIGLYEALERSSNVYFASAALEMGGEALQETANKFKIGQYPELDFGSITSKFLLDRDNKNELADTAYGQGRTLFSTMCGGMMVQAIANGGIMMKPYLIYEMMDSDGKTAYMGEAQPLSQVTTQETASKITEALKLVVGANYAHMEEKDVRTYERYQIVGKTGTGENGDKAQTNSAWFVSFAPADNPQYVVVVNQGTTDKYGSSLMDTAGGIYRYLFEEPE